MRNYFFLFILILFWAFLSNSCKENDEVLPELNVADSLFFPEGTDTQLKATVLLKLTTAASKDVTVKWSTLNGSAIDGEDYIGQTGVITVIHKGSTEAAIEVALIPDDIYEPDRVYSVSISSVENATLGNSTCKITIQDDDPFIPELLLNSRFAKPEGNSGQTIIRVPVILSGPSSEEVRFTWSTVPGWAKADEDFLPVSDESVIFSPGDIEKFLEVALIGDDIFEMDDYFDINLTGIQGASFFNSTVRVYIDNDDTYQPELVSDGYITPDSWPGMQLVWNDEFEGPLINSGNWTHELGGGGWGNNELEIYTSSSTNSFITGGKLRIVATKEGDNYYSARIVTKGKRQFTYGRIDIRAKMPYGKGIWPALWTLGANNSQVGWPRCGEIDIMEYLGHIQSQVHGTIHYYQSGNKSMTASYTLPGSQSFHDNFHVFTVVWQENTIKWYVDYQLFHQAKDTQATFEAFRLPHFFIFNLAVGGNWPGYPDNTTVFPQTLEVDYIRVFQPD